MDKININGKFNIASQRPTWYITGNGTNGTTSANRKIGSTYSTGTGTGLLNVLTTYGGATASDYSTTDATFTASVSGTYFFQFNVFKNTTNSIGRSIQFVTTRFMETQYCTFNEQSTAAECSFNWTALIYLSAGGSAYFYNPSAITLTLFYGSGHINLTITQLF